MGSFQQILLASLCLGAAVLFGNFVNYSSPEELDSVAADVSDLSDDVSPVQAFVATDELDFVSSAPAPISRMRTRMQPMLAFSDDANADDVNGEPSVVQKGGGLPPPSQLARDDPKPNFVAPQLVSTTQRFEVPDFSEIAAELSSGPIKLLPLGTMPSIERPPVTAPVAKRVEPNAAPANVSNSIAHSEPVERMPRMPRRQPSSLIAGGELPMKSIMAAPTESPISTNGTYQVAEGNGGFTSEDFEPSLRGDPRIVASSPKRSGAVVSLLPASQIALPTREQWERRSERVDTGYPPSNGSTAVRPTESDVPRSSNRVRTKLPFRLSETARGELVASRSRATTKLALETTRFVDHYVQPGETLQTISIRYFGKPDFYLDIYLANRGKLRNPSGVPSGMIVKVPVYDE